MMIPSFENFFRRFDFTWNAIQQFRIIGAPFLLASETVVANGSRRKIGYFSLNK